MWQLNDMVFQKLKLSARRGLSIKYIKLSVPVTGGTTEQGGCGSSKD